MIDLNLRNQDAGIRNQDETPIGVVILGVLPFVMGFWMMIWRAL